MLARALAIVALSLFVVAGACVTPRTYVAPRVVYYEPLDVYGDWVWTSSYGWVFVPFGARPYAFAYGTWVVLPVYGHAWVPPVRYRSRVARPHLVIHRDDAAVLRERPPRLPPERQRSVSPRRVVRPVAVPRSEVAPAERDKIPRRVAPTTVRREKVRRTPAVRPDRRREAAKKERARARAIERAREREEERREG